MASKINDEALISVIMPVYNSEKYVVDAIKSVLNQTYHNIELIVIDDFSTDGTASIVKELSQMDSRIKFHINNKNLGVSAARNKGVSLSRGDWIAYLDSDDMWTDNKLEKQYNLINVKNVDFVFTGSSFVNEKGKSLEWTLGVPEKITFKELLKQNVISCSSVLIKKHYVEKYKMDRDDIHEDFGTWLRILKSGTYDENNSCGMYAYGINEPLLIYRISSNSKSGNKIKSMMMNYKTYRYVGLNPLTSLYYMCWYVVRGLRKYGKLKNIWD